METLKSQIAAQYLRQNWPLISPEKKLHILGQCGVGADSVDTMHHALEHCLGELGGEVVAYLLINPDKTPADAVEAVEVSR